MKKYVKANTIVPLLFLILAALWLPVSLSLPNTSTVPGSGPGTFANAILTIMLVASGIVLVQEIQKIRSFDENVDFDWIGIRNVALMIVALILYSLLLRRLGFVICAILLTEFSLLLFGQRKIVWLIVIPLGFTFLIYTVFRFGLNILLPTIWLP